MFLKGLVEICRTLFPARIPSDLRPKTAKRTILIEDILGTLYADESIQVLAAGISSTGLAEACKALFGSAARIPALMPEKPWMSWLSIDFFPNRRNHNASRRIGDLLC